MPDDLLIIECIPKCDNKEEGLILHGFLEMTSPKHVESLRVTSKSDLLEVLSDKLRLRKFEYVHISGHGDKINQVFITPKGVLRPDEFPFGCFKNKTVTLSACELGRTDFINEFIETTEARRVIAPMNEILFVDAAIWFVNFYYWSLNFEMQPKVAFNRTMNYLSGKASGAMGFWD